MGNINYSKIGERIKAARTSLFLTQEQAAERCDITPSFYGNIERGNKKMSVETLVKISKGLKISVDRILFGDAASTSDDEVSHICQAVRQAHDPDQYKKYLEIIRTLAGIIDRL
ncbi:MAG: helix-turn-helix transcriptional regulator [Eubacteriales bacterium]|nr:helix-turn-helix transcriptional regulator [Eubacteriales bacterium]